MLLTDYINRFADLRTRPDFYRYYEKIIDLVNGYREVILDQQGIILSWNPALEKATCFQSREIVGQHLGLLYLPHDRQEKKPEQFLARALEQGVATHFGQCVRKDGATFTASMKLLAIRKSKLLVGYTLAVRMTRGNVKGRTNDC